MINTRNLHLKLIFTLLIAHSSLLIAFAQTADRVETILQTPAVTHEQAAWLVLEAANTRGYDRSSTAGAFQFATEKQLLPGNAGPADKISLSRVSLLIMKAFDMKGGLWYSLFKNPHYAYREMVYQDIIQGRTAPGMDVSGELLLFLVNRVLYNTDSNPWLLRPAMSTAPRVVRTEEQVKEEMALVDEINTQLESLDMTNASARLTDEGITISLSNIQFLADSSELPEREKQNIREIARLLELVPGRGILVSGHTAQAGTEAGRLQISRDRAQSVADYLVELGVRKADELVVQGYGSQRPLGDNNTPEGMALNRRVEITILEEQQ